MKTPCVAAQLDPTELWGAMRLTHPVLYPRIRETEGSSGLGLAGDSVSPPVRGIWTGLLLRSFLVVFGSFSLWLLVSENML